jgi:putative oxidoreductase
MKKSILIARILLGLIFFFFGASHIVDFLHAPLPPGDAGTFAMILANSKIMTIIGLLEVIAGLLLLVGRYVPLALVILGPIIVNILLFALLIAKSFPGAIPGLICLIAELFLLWVYRRSFRSLFDAAPEVS